MNTDEALSAESVLMLFLRTFLSICLAGQLTILNGGIYGIYVLNSIIHQLCQDRPSLDNTDIVIYTTARRKCASENSWSAPL